MGVALTSLQHSHYSDTLCQFKDGALHDRHDLSDDSYRMTPTTKAYSMKSDGWTQDLDHTLLERALFENGLSFLQRAMHAAAQENPDQQEMTHAAVDLAVAIEVLLKARLVREHWALVCVDIGKNTKSDLRSGKAKTVSPEVAVARLSGVAGVDLDVERVKSIVDLRNRAAHFTLETTPDFALHATFGRGLHFIHGLIGAEFTRSPDRLVTDTAFHFLNEGRDHLTRIDSYVRARLAEIEPDLLKATLCLECPLCHQAALVVDEAPEGEGGALCRFCSSGPHDEELADLYVENVLNMSSHVTIKDGGEWPVHECFECGRESLVEGIRQLRPPPDAATDEQAGQPEPVFAACFSCALTRQGSQYVRCHRCSRPSERELCPDCAHAVFGGDGW